MTYRQIFDEAIGAAPPPAVDIDALVAREGRRRRRRLSVYASATAVLALALGVGVVVQPGASGGPAPAHSAALSATARTEPERLRAAMLAAFHREAPDLRWVQGASIADRETWDGPVTDTPPWTVKPFQWESMTGWSAVGVAARGEVRSYLTIGVGRMRPGHTSPGDCTPGQVTCRSFTGPAGELVVAHDTEGRRLVGSVTQRTVLRSVTVERADGTNVSVQTHSSTDRHLMAVEEMAGVALDPAIRLG
ncbi:hypothetical protein COO58_06150 [Micromonospora sp. WMMA1996]|uniref:hypothetical protein n=1 Tax=Micromonospora sp. WMMA1996 TaxID=2039878 RepID=UPI000BF88789|nr:hypothetical protein [Micromonospora sp. WMMA1996]PGH44058.1 hypothetical protein COO58_06150 [Micromonospora sp. WMMA1996]